AEEDPRSGRALQRLGALERRARAERQQRSARCPLGRSAPPPPSAQRSPPQRRGPGNPPARFFVQFQQSSEEIASTLRKEEGGAVAPPPPLGQLPGEKSPSTRPKYTARQPPAPGLLLATSPSPSLSPSAANPVTCPLGKTSSPGLCASRRVPWQRPPPSCAPQLVAGVASPGGAHDLGTRTLPTRLGILAPTPRAEWPPSVLRALASLPLSVSASATALLAECARLWASPGSPRPGQVPLPLRAAAPAGVGC
ncbi:hypothetical protein A6R68_05035, partial [Neotoma lepida]